MFKVIPLEFPCWVYWEKACLDRCRLKFDRKVPRCCRVSYCRSRLRIWLHRHCQNSNLHCYRSTRIALQKHCLFYSWSKFERGVIESRLSSISRVSKISGRSSISRLLSISRKSPDNLDNIDSLDIFDNLRYWVVATLYQPYGYSHSLWASHIFHLSRKCRLLCSLVSSERIDPRRNQKSRFRPKNVSYLIKCINTYYNKCHFWAVFEISFSSLHNPYYKLNEIYEWQNGIFFQKSNFLFILKERQLW